RGLRSDRLRCNGLGCGRGRFILLLAQKDICQAGDDQKDEKATHSLFWSSWRAITPFSSITLIGGCCASSQMGGGTVMRQNVIIASAITSLPIVPARLPSRLPHPARPASIILFPAMNSRARARITG